MMHKAWSSIEEVPYCFWRSSVKFQGHTAKKNHRFWPKLDVSRLKNRRFESNLSKITRPVAAIKSLRFALLSRGMVFLVTPWRHTKTCVTRPVTKAPTDGINDSRHRTVPWWSNDKAQVLKNTPWCHDNMSTNMGIFHLISCSTLR